ncbi:MFS transporter [Acinetobacter sp. SwsAc6]|uniref:MFS transporter n=1 Tax=Acinetobacter TaxID=469 RepID=UPI000EA1F5C2|nr:MULTISPECIES: MFS transporter [Acinetobacter]NWK75402.1 MFS transporter [Acinetobacter sp. SwsAc6]RKG47482.1 MFS transporter [Acinetobacter cumulans]
MKQNNKIFIAASLANGASFSMILPLLAPLVRKLQLSELQAGAMVSIGALLMACAAIYISKNQTKFSIYQLLSIGFIGMAVTWGLFSGVLMYGLTAQISVMLLFTLLMLARASTGVFMAMPQIALQTHVMTSYEEEQLRSKTMSKFGALNSVGVVFGPFLTTLLLAWGIMTPLWAAIAILSIISVVIVVLFDQQKPKDASSENSISLESSTLAQQEHAQHKKSTDTDEIQQDGQNFSLKRSMAWLVLGFSLYLAIVTVNLTAGFYIQDHFKTSVLQGATYFSQCSLLVGISLVVMQVLISKKLKWSVYTLLWVGLVAMSIALWISVSTEHLRVFQLAYVLYGVSVACLIPAFTTGAAQIAPKHQQAKVASWCTATQALSFVIGPILSTGLYQWHTSYPYYFLMLTMFALMVFFAFKQISPEKKLNWPVKLTS